MNPTGQSRETDASLLITFEYRIQYGLVVGLSNQPVHRVKGLVTLSIIYMFYHYIFTCGSLRDYDIW